MRSFVCGLHLAFQVFFAVHLAHAQSPPYDVFPKADAPYFRVRYEASKQPGKLVIPVNYTIWVPPNIERLRGVVVHQHGCGEGSCRSGLTGAFDLHWQALAQKHDCALLSPSYEQPQEVDCQLWCDPRNGSDQAFRQALVDLGEMSGHTELSEVPWALWGHSGGGHWAGGMTLLHPDRVAAAWLRSGVPIFEALPDRPSIKPHELPNQALSVPIMCNLGTKEGVSVTEGRFARVWPSVESFFQTLRRQGGLVGVAVDPLTSHECGNQRYLAIPWLDACLTARLSESADGPLRPMPAETAWLAEPTGTDAKAAKGFKSDPLSAAWLPSESIAVKWEQYVADTEVTDKTPPPSPTEVSIAGNRLSWNAEADPDSGLARFIILRDGKEIATVPSESSNRFGRPLFQGLQYSDTPLQPLVRMEFVDEEADNSQPHEYQVIAENTVGLRSTK